MIKEDLFEVIKGNVKSVNLSKVIAEKEQEFINWILPYYTGEELVRFHKRQTMYTNIHIQFVYSEPEWPKGKVRSLTKQYRRKVDQINKLKSIQSSILALAFPEYQDDEATYEVENIIVKRTPAE
jgi:hypothetical protein